MAIPPFVSDWKPCKFYAIRERFRQDMPDSYLGDFGQISLAAVFGVNRILRRARLSPLGRGHLDKLTYLLIEAVQNRSRNLFIS